MCVIFPVLRTLRDIEIFGLVTSFWLRFLFYRAGYTVDGLRRMTSACYRLGYCYMLVDRVYKLKCEETSLEICTMLRQWDLFLGQLSTLIFFISLSSDWIITPFMGELLLLLRTTASVREPTSHLIIPAGGPSPQIGRRRESIPGPPDPRTEALPTELARSLAEIEYFLNEDTEGVLTDTLMNFHDWHLTWLSQFKPNVMMGQSL